MFQLPEYFNEFNSIMAEPIVEHLVSVEKQFSLINYDDHKDEIASIFTDHDHFTSKNTADVIFSIYREHMDYTLSNQGIFLKDPYYSPIISMINIFVSVTLLATKKLSELLTEQQVIVDNSNDFFFAHIVEDLTDQPIHETLDMIDSITDQTIDYLRTDHELPIFHHSIAEEAKNRFKQSTLEKTGVVVELIKILNQFGYNLKTVLIAYAEILADLKETSDCAKEIILLVLASDTPNRLLLQTMLTVSEHIVDNATAQLAVNTEIKRYMDNQYEKA